MVANVQFLMTGWHKSEDLRQRGKRAKQRQKKKSILLLAFIPILLMDCLT